MIPGDGTARHTFICVDDVAGFLAAAAISGPSGIHAIGGPEALTFLDIVRLYERILGGAADTAILRRRRQSHGLELYRGTGRFNGRSGSRGGFRRTTDIGRSVPPPEMRHGCWPVARSRPSPTPPPATGRASSAGYIGSLQATPHRFGLPVNATYAGLAPGYVGLYQFNVVVPNLAASDSVPLTFTLAGAKGPQNLVIAIQN
jgi:hypothetical protein